ncbi:MAG: hypothetical protein LOD91_05535, partial [Limnochordales bacterium]
MATRRRTTRVLLVPAVLALALVLTACGSNWEQVLRPPRADVTGIQVVAVFPFASWTVDPGLARSITDRVYRALRDSGWYEVIPPEQVESVLVQRGVDPRSVVGGQLAAEVAQELGADAYVAGVADYYFEDASMDAPYARPASEPQEGVQWWVRQRTMVIVGMQGHMYNVHTMQEVHRWQGQREAEVYDARQLNWVSADPPPPSVIPPVHRRDIPRAREEAIQRAVDSFAADILPRYEWTQREPAEQPR